MNITSKQLNAARDAADAAKAALDAANARTRELIHARRLDEIDTDELHRASAAEGAARDAYRRADAYARDLADVAAAQALADAAAAALACASTWDGKPTTHKRPRAILDAASSAALDGTGWGVSWYGDEVTAYETIGDHWSRVDAVKIYVCDWVGVNAYAWSAERMRAALERLERTRGLTAADVRKLSRAKYDAAAKVERAADAYRAKVKAIRATFSALPGGAPDVDRVATVYA